MNRATRFRSGSSSPEQVKMGRQSVRGRISAPIPIPGSGTPPAEDPASKAPPAADAAHQETSIPEEGPATVSQSPGSSAAHQDPQVSGPNDVSSAEPGGDGSPETADLPEPMPPLQPQKVRPAAASLGGLRRVPTAEQHQESPPPPPLQQQQQQQQQQEQAKKEQPQQTRPQTLSGTLAQPSQQPGPGPSRAGVRPTAAVASSISAGNVVAASPALRHRTNPSSTLRYSEASGISTGAGTSAGNTVNGSPKPQRKRSTLRGTLSKLFGRRKKVASQILAPIASQAPEMAPQHRSVRSDPTVLGRPRDGGPNRSASLPITEYDRALRSHSVGPHEIAAIENARTSFQAESISGNPDTGSGRRHASASANRFPYRGHRHFSNKSAEVLSGSEWAGLSPRPASAHGRGSNNRASGPGTGNGEGSGNGNDVHLGFGIFGAGIVRRNGASTDPDEIGRAITSDAPGSSDFNGRRRSRSLSGLNEIAFDQTQARRRSDEIRFWRESYSVLSPLSYGQEMDVDDDAETENQDEQRHDDGNHDDDGEDDEDDEDEGEGEDEGDGGEGDERGNALTDHGVFSGGDDDIVGALHSVPDSPVGQRDQEQLRQQQQQQQQQQQRPKSPPEPFPFGNLSSLGTMSGSMRITQANGLNTRLGGLETRMEHVERVVDQLCHAVPGFKGPMGTSSIPFDQIPRSAPAFPGSVSSYPPGGGGFYSSEQPALPPIPAVYQSQVAYAQASSGPAGDGNQLYTPNASSSRYSNSRHSAYSGHSLDSDVHSHMSFGDGQTYIGSLHPPSSSATQQQSILAPAPGAVLSPGGYSPGFRPKSTSTVRGAASLPTLGAANDSTADLSAQLESERAVRQALETQVKKLNERVNALSTTMYAMLRDPAAKPRKSREPLATPSSSSLRDHSAAALKAESVIQTAKALGHGLPADAESGSDGFLTPIEDGKGEEDGHFHYDCNDDDAAGQNDPYASHANTKRQKKAARTLSLGQLTLGKSAVQA